MGACSNTEELRRDYLQEVNFEYTKKLWKAACEYKFPFIYASSAATYGDGALGFSDDVNLIPKLKPLNLYGESKQLFDLFVLDEVTRAHTPPQWAGLKFFNVYGPGEEHKGSQASVLFHARNQFLERAFVRLFKSHNPNFKDGEQLRDFIYVEDAASVALACGEGRVKSGIYNVGTGKARTFKDLVYAVAGALGVESKIEYIDTPLNLRDKYQYKTQAEIKKLRSAGFAESFRSLEEGANTYMKYLSDFS